MDKPNEKLITSVDLHYEHIAAVLRGREERAVMAAIEAGQQSVARKQAARVEGVAGA